MITNRDEKFLKDHGVTTWGNFNNPPLPYKECDISRFWDKFSSYTTRDSEFRQVFLDEKRTTNVHILVYHDEILMIQVNYEYTNASGVKYTPVCYLVGCDHDFESNATIRGEGTSTCKKCGYSYNYDSSD
jgi:hypothetical protein